MMMPVKHPFSAFAPENTPLLRENQYNYIRFDSLNSPFHYPRTHYSTIPAFPPGRRPNGPEANWGEAPNLIKDLKSHKFFKKVNIKNQFSSKKHFAGSVIRQPDQI
jgi:hypothetical protein